jgi:hypothetical protein
MFLHNTYPRTHFTYVVRTILLTYQFLFTYVCTCHPAQQIYTAHSSHTYTYHPAHIPVPVHIRVYVPSGTTEMPCTHFTYVYVPSCSHVCSCSHTCVRTIRHNRDAPPTFHIRIRTILLTCLFLFEYVCMYHTAQQRCPPQTTQLKQPPVSLSQQTILIIHGRSSSSINALPHSFKCYMAATTYMSIPFTGAV